MKQARIQKLIRPTALAIALAVPGAVGLAEPMDVVRTRDLNGVSQDFGRAGGSAYVDSRDAALASQQSQAAASAWDETKAGAATAWAGTKTFATQQPAISPEEPQRYGRAGGFIGVEQFEVPQPGVTALSSAPASANAVKTGDVQWGYTDRASASRSAANSANPATPLPYANAPTESAEHYNYSPPAATVESNGGVSTSEPAEANASGDTSTDTDSQLR